MKEATLFKYATQRVAALTVLLTVILVIWHLTLINSDIPYINHPISWATTIISPFLALVGCNIILALYKKAGSLNNSAGDLPAPDGFTMAFADDLGAVLFGIVGIIMFFLLLPAILFLLPAEFLLGALYYKQSIREEIFHAWSNLTPKEGIFIITKSIFILIAVSCIVWEIVMHILYWIVKIFKLIANTSNEVKE